MSETVRETPKQRLAYWAYRTVAWLAGTLPERVGRMVFAWLGRLAYRTLPGVRATVTANQARVLGVDAESGLARSAAREAFDLYARYWFDTFRLRVMPAAEVNKRMGHEGVDRIDRALEAGRGAICVLPHMGNWDAAGRWLAINGYRVAAVAEELRPRRLLELFLEHRRELGLRIVTLSTGTHVGQQLASLLKDNWVVALVADRDLTGRGVEVEMFGAKRRVPAGPALLSLSTGAPLMVCSVSTMPHGWFTSIGEPIEYPPTGVTRDDVAALSRLMAARFERAIAAWPVDWHMFQSAWEEP